MVAKYTMITISNFITFRLFSRILHTLLFPVCSVFESIAMENDTKYFGWKNELSTLLVHFDIHTWYGNVNANGILLLMLLKLHSKVEI